MNQAFTAARWEDFTDVVEPGSHLLTMEFLISLYFRFFNEPFEMTLKEFSIALGFLKRCILDPNTIAEDTSTTVVLGGA